MPTARKSAKQQLDLELDYESYWATLPIPLSDAVKRASVGIDDWNRGVIGDEKWAIEVKRRKEERARLGASHGKR